ncbi:MFS transporter [Streptomyces sp. NBC_00503]|uniref:MFS transporter n=1 Tax=Streptomyces sp. NBC_00503 TaxID=2903659 RepID=UPI002E805612|nr:MFS transporter [Streptomyces sp. NBC_00503]WUD86503.1 flavin reductase [Streptomyces sp. NBC_00503]
MPPTERLAAAERRSLRSLLSAYAVSQFGNWLFRTGVVYYAYNQSHGSTALLTTAIVLVYLPILFGSRLLAPLADRYETRRMLIGLDALRAVVLAVLLAAVWGGIGFTSAATIGVMGFLSLLTPFFTASQTAYLRRVLPTDGMPSALAAVSKVDWSMFILGTAAAPLMLQVSNLPVLISLDIVSFVVSGLLLIRLMPAPAPAPTPTGGGQAGAAAGSGKLRLTPGSKWLLVSVFALNAGAGLINVYPNVVARGFLGGGAMWLSVINLANGAGAVLGATLAARMGKQRGLRPGVLAAVAVAVSLLGMTFVTTAWVAVLASSTMLLAGQVFAVVFQSRILQNEPVAVAGRVSGLFTLGTFAGVTLSILLFMGITSFGSMRGSFTVLLFIAAAAALVSAWVGQVAARRHGVTAPEPAGAEAGRAEQAGGPDADADAEALLVRRAGRAFATGVAVASTVGVDSGVPHATTVNSFVTVSLDPPLVMVCVEHTSHLASLVTEGAPLGVTVLGAGQRETAAHFARGDRPLGEEQFEGHPWRPGKETGAPLLEAGTAWLECRVQTLLPAGDHTIVLALVRAFTASEDPGEGPLVFFGGAFHALDVPPSGPAVPAGFREGER